MNEMTRKRFVHFAERDSKIQIRKGVDLLFLFLYFPGWRSNLGGVVSIVLYLFIARVTFIVLYKNT